jgi:hypothetical protein
LFYEAGGLRGRVRSRKASSVIVSAFSTGEQVNSTGDGK